MSERILNLSTCDIFAREKVVYVGWKKRHRDELGAFNLVFVQIITKIRPDPNPQNGYFKVTNTGKKVR